MSFERHLQVQLDRLGRDGRDLDGDTIDHDYDRYTDGEYAL